MKAWRILLCVLALAVSLAACSIQALPPQTGADTPGGNLPGFLEAAAHSSGGENLVGLNLYDVELAQVAGNTEMTFTFNQGSLVMGLPESAASGVPRYAIDTCTGLNRLVLRIEDLAFWDYTVFEDELARSDVLGVYQQIPVNTNETRLYISLPDAYAYQAETRENQLILRIKMLNREPQAHWYAVLDAAALQEAGKLADLAMSPVLCSDAQHAVLLSAPFPQEEEARAFAQQVQQRYGEVLQSEVLCVKLSSDALPDYNSLGILQTTQREAVWQSPQGEQVAAQTLCPNGSFLCWKPALASYAFSRPFFLREGGEVVSTYEKLFLAGQDEASEEVVVEFDFSSIVEAAFSPNGRMLAFLDQTTARRLLYVYDFDREVLLSGTEEGIGGDTTAFVWGADNTLYTLSTEMSETQLYTMQFANDTCTVTLEEGVLFQDGSFAYCGGAFFSVQSDYESGQSQVLRYTQGQEMQALCAGFSFVASPDGRWLAVLQDASDGCYDLLLWDVQSGQSTTVVQKAAISDVLFSRDASTLYYSVYADLENDIDYPLCVYQYQNGQTRVCGQARSGSLHPGQNANEVLLVHVYAREGEFIPVTYVLPS